MSFVPKQEFTQTVFGELVNTELTPVIQIDADNGIREDVEAIFSNATAIEENSNYVIETGANANAFVSLLSARVIKFRAGQGVTGRFSALFETSAADSAQAAGFFNDSEGFVFGYDGTEFGVGRYYGGKSELQFLQVTTGAGGAENATVTVDGVAYTVPLTAGTVNHNAYEIAVSLNSQVDFYDFSSNQDTVTAIDELARTAGAFAFTSATAVAAWTQSVVGVEATQEWVPQADWNNPPDWGFDPSKGNLYQIEYLWGYGGIRFSIANTQTGVMEPVHSIVYANTSTVPLVEEPSFRIGWAIRHYGSTTSLTVKGSDAACLIDGRIVQDERSRGLSVAEVALSTTPINLISIRNRLEYSNKTNRITTYPQAIIIGGEHNKSIQFYIQVDTTFIGDMEYTYVDEKNSCMEYSFSGAQPNLDGRDLGTPTIRAPGSLPLDITKLLQYLNPGETLTIAAELNSGTNGEGDLSIYWLEDQ